MTIDSFSVLLCFILLYENDSQSHFNLIYYRDLLALCSQPFRRNDVMSLRNLYQTVLI